MKITVKLDVYGDCLSESIWDIIELFKKYGLDATKLKGEWWNFYDELNMLLQKKFGNLEVIA
jgi:hypothetical protein